MNLGDGKAEEVHKHPSYGMLQFSRVTSGHHPKMFGAGSFSPNYVEMRLYPGEMQHHLGSDWFRAANHIPIVEVRMTELQMGQLLSTMNVGDGVPVTIEIVEGKRIPEPPDIGTEPERIAEAFKKRMQDVRDNSSAEIAELKMILGKDGAINKGDRQRIGALLDKFEMEIGSNTTFALNQFQASAERVVTEAKASVSVYAAQQLQAVGLDPDKSSPILNLE